MTEHADMGALVASLLDEVRGLRADLRANAEASASSLLDPDELAAMLKVAPRTIRRLELLGEIPSSISVGAAKRWRRSDIEAWLAERRSA